VVGQHNTIILNSFFPNARSMDAFGDENERNEERKHTKTGLTPSSRDQTSVFPVYLRIHALFFTHSDDVTPF